MGLASGTQPLPFGHSAEAAIDIEGLAVRFIYLVYYTASILIRFQLLEDHLQRLRDEDGIIMNEDDEDEAAWQGWDVESDSSDGSESEGWIDVEDNDDTLNISDSEDEGDKLATGAQNADDDPTSSTRISTLATTKVSDIVGILHWYSFVNTVYGQILTPADFTLLNDLRIQEANKAVENGGGSHAKRKLATLEANKRSLQSDQQPENSFVSENDILGPRKKAKSDYAERMASIQKGREGREKYKSNKGKVNKETPSSSTNREKARNKPIMMILSSGAVRSKKKASLREKQQKLRAHIEKAKKARH